MFFIIHFLNLKQLEARHCNHRDIYKSENDISGYKIQNNRLREEI